MSYIHSTLQSRVSANSDLGRQPIDDALADHVHGSMYPFHTDSWNPTHVSCTYPSRKYKSFARGTFVTGTTDSWGYVFCEPYASNDSSVVEFSAGGAFVYDAFGNASTSGTNSPYANATFNSTGNLSRNNACGLRIRNITPMLNRGGTCYALRSASDQRLTGAFSSIIANLDVTGNSKRCDTSGDRWNYLYWVPRDVDQTEFQPYAYTVADAVGTQIFANLAFVAQAPAGTPQTYEWEYVCWSDIITTAASLAIHGATQNDPHIHTMKAHQVIAALQARPEVSQNEPSHYLSNFVTRAVLEGHRIADIVQKGCDIASRTASVAPEAMRVGKMLLKAIA